MARVIVVVALLATACSSGSMTSSATDSDATTTTSSTTTDGVSSTSLSTSTSSSSSTSTSSSSTTSSDETSTTEPETTTGQVCPTPESYECDPWAQDECCEDEKCNAWASDGGSAWLDTKCVPVDPDPDKVGEPCMVVGDVTSGVDSCEKGAMCWDVDSETNLGVCVALCVGSVDACSRDPWSCCPEVHACTQSGSGNLILCLEFCDPLAQNCETSGELCYPIGDRFQCAPDVSGDMGAVGDPCEFVNACDPGTYCGDRAAYPGCDLNAPGCCIPFCPLDAPECAPGTECLPWYDPMNVPPGFENLGACTIPP